MKQIEAIQVRKSTRKYDPTTLPEEQLARVRALLDEAPALAEEPRVRFQVVDGATMSEVLPFFIGWYGKVSAPHWIVATAPHDEEVYERTGYALEPVVLELTSMGLATCWVGGVAAGEGYRSVVEFPADEHVTVLVSFGKPADGADHTRAPGTGKRKPLAESLLSDAGPWEASLEVARIAPSAGNTQPWRFLAEGDRLHAFSRTKIPLHYRVMLGQHLRLMNRLDVGIALAHLRIAEEAAGRRLRFEREPGRAIEGMTYIATAVRED